MYRHREVTAIISALVICIIVCLSWAVIITVITPLPTKLTRQKCEELKLAVRQLLTYRCVSVMLLRSMQKYEGVADAKAENESVCVIDVAAGRRRLHVKAVCQSVREATTASAWIMQPTDWQTHAVGGLFHPEEADHYAKNN